MEAQPRPSSFVRVPKRILQYSSPDQQNSNQCQPAGKRYNHESSVQSAVGSYNTIFNDQLKNWMESQLKLFQQPDKMFEIPRASLHHVLEAFSSSLPSAALNEVSVKLEQTVLSHVNFLLQLKEEMQAISMVFIKGLQEKSWFNDDVEDITTTVLKQSCQNKGYSTDVKQTWLKLATECLSKEYNQFKKIVTQREMSTARKVVIRLIESFKSTFQMLIHSPFDQEHLTQIYKTLVSKYVNAFHNSLSYKRENNVFALKYEDTLRKKLEQEFSVFKTANQVKCKKLQGKVNKIIDKLRMQHSSKIDNENPDGIEDFRLLEYHDELSSQLFETLEKQIKREVGENEPIDPHWATLFHHIRNYFSSVRKENMEKRKKFPSPKLQEEKEQPNKRETRNFGESEEVKDYPHPLLFRLNMQNLLCCTLVQEKLHFFSGPGGQFNVPMTVALNNNGDFIYGVDATEKEDFQGIWFLEKCFTDANEKPPWGEIVYINGQSFLIHVEFLLGFLLKKLKDSAEKQLSARFIKAIITVPNWFGSTHKIHVKDAGVVGGFSEVYLINELSAVAFGHVQRKLNEKTSASLSSSNTPETFVVVEENNNFVHAAVYTFNQKYNLVLMLGDCMNYCYEGGKDVRSICQSAVNLAYSNSFELAISLEKSIKTFLLLSDSELGMELLKSVTNSSYDLDAATAILTGAALLGMNPKEIGLRVKDQIASDVLMMQFSTSPGRCERKTVITKEIGLPAESEMRLLSKLDQTRDICFYQNVGPSRTDIPIGKLTVTASCPASIPKEIQPVFKVNREGIVDLAFVKVFFETNSESGKMYEVYNATAKCVRWVTPNLTSSLRKEVSVMLRGLERGGVQESIKIQSLEDISILR